MNVYPNQINDTAMAINADTFINNMLGEIIDQIMNGKSNLPVEEQEKLKDDVPFKNSNFFTWCTPGIPVSSEDFAFLKGLRKPIDYEKWKDLPEAEKEAKKGDETHALTVAMDNFSVLVDTVPNKSGAIDSLQVWEPQNRISHIYESVLKSCEVEDKVTSPEDQERINEIIAATVQIVEREDEDTGERFSEERPTKMVAAYLKYSSEYLVAYEKYTDLINKSMTGNAGDVQKASILGPAYYQSVNTAYSMWETNGYKAMYETLVADKSLLEGVSMSLLRNEYLEIFRKSKRMSLIDFMDYNTSRLVPASFFDSSGWTEYSFSSSKLKTTDLSKTQKYSGGAKFGFVAGTRGSHERLDAMNSMDFEGVTVKLKLAQVPIVRGWFREDFLLSTKWRIKSNGDAASTVNPGDILSNGNIENPDGKLFAYPTVILFGRDITLSKNIYNKISNEITRDSNGSTGFSLGPILLGGKASYNKTQKNLQIKDLGQYIMIVGTCILGFRNHILPLCPNPDPSITKWI